MPDDPKPAEDAERAGLLSKGLLAAAALAAVGALAAFAGAGPFTGVPAATAAPMQANAQVQTSAPVAVAPSAAPPAAGPCGPGGTLNGAEDLTTSGAVAVHVTQDCGPGPVGGAPHCTPAQVLPYSAGQSSYTYDFYGGFYAGGVHYEMHFPGSGIDPAYTVQYPRAPTAANRGHVTMTSYENFAPASVWQSADGAPTGSISWTATTVTLTNVTLTALASSPKPAAPVTVNGTWAVHCAADAAAATVAPAAAASVAPVAVVSAAPAAAVPVSAAVAAAPPQGGPSPWGPGLAVVAAAAAAAAFVTKARSGATPRWEPRTRWEAPREYAADDPDREAKLRLDQLIENARENMRGGEAARPETVGGDNSVRGGGCLNIFGTVIASLGSDPRDPDRVYRHWQAEYDKLVEERRGYEGFQPRPPENAPGEGEPGDRQEIG